MKKSELIIAVSSRAGTPKAQVESIVGYVFDLITEGLSMGERVDLGGFGTFLVREEAARTSRDPQTGEEIHIAARKIPDFHPGNELRSSVNRK